MRGGASTTIIGPYLIDRGDVVRSTLIHIFVGCYVVVDSARQTVKNIRHVTFVEQSLPSRWDITTGSKYVKICNGTLPPHFFWSDDEPRDVQVPTQLAPRHLLFERPSRKLAGECVWIH